MRGRTQYFGRNTRLRQNTTNSINRRNPFQHLILGKLTQDFEIRKLDCVRSLFGIWMCFQVLVNAEEVVAPLLVIAVVL